MPPHRFSHGSVARFVPLLLDLVRNKPNEIEIDYRSFEISQATCAGRARDAVRAITTGLYECSELTSAELLTAWPAYQVAEVGDRVLFIRKGSKPTDSLKATNSAGLSVKHPTTFVLNALALLVSEKVIQSVEVEVLDTQELDALNDKYDLGIVPNGLNKYILC